MKYYTKEWYEFVQRCASHRDLNNPLIDQPDKDYVNVLKEQNVSQALLRKLDFHDSELLDIRTEENAMVLQMEDRGEGWDQRIILRNPRILKQDEPLIGYDWIYNELYRIGCGYELHILLLNWRNSELPWLAELTIQCDEIEIE